MVEFSFMTAESLEQMISQKPKLIVVRGTGGCCICRTTFNKIDVLIKKEFPNDGIELIAVNLESDAGKLLTSQVTKKFGQLTEQTTLTAYYRDGNLVHYKQGYYSQSDEIRKAIWQYFTGP